MGLDGNAIKENLTSYYSFYKYYKNFNIVFRGFALINICMSSIRNSTNSKHYTITPKSALCSGSKYLVIIF